MIAQPLKESLRRRLSIEGEGEAKSSKSNSYMKHETSNNLCLAKHIGVDPQITGAKSHFHFTLLGKTLGDFGLHNNSASSFLATVQIPLILPSNDFGVHESIQRQTFKKNFGPSS